MIYTLYMCVSVYHPSTFQGVWHTLQSGRCGFISALSSLNYLHPCKSPKIPPRKNDHANWQTWQRRSHDSHGRLEPQTVTSVATCHPKSLQHEILGTWQTRPRKSWKDRQDWGRTEKYRRVKRITEHVGEYSGNMGEYDIGYRRAPENIGEYRRIKEDQKACEAGLSLKPSSAGFSHPVFGASSEVVQHSWPRQGPQVTEEISIIKQISSSLQATNSSSPRAPTTSREKTEDQ